MAGFGCKTRGVAQVHYTSVGSIVQLAGVAGTSCFTATGGCFTGLSSIEIGGRPTSLSTAAMARANLKEIDQEIHRRRAASGDSFAGKKASKQTIMRNYEERVHLCVFLL